MIRLPIYILINTSSSICNETLQNFKDCINLIIETLQEDPETLETTYISIIKFNNTINRLCSLSPLSSFIMPSIKIEKQASSLGHALLQLTTIIDNELFKNNYKQICYQKPFIFILTDNDSVVNITKETRESVCYKHGKIIICTKKDSVNSDQYKNITNNILPIESLDKQTIKSQFCWLSESMVTSEKVNSFKLPPLPNSICFDIDSNYSEQNFTYESTCPLTTASDKTDIKELKTAYEKYIRCLNQEQELLKSVHSQIDDLKKENEFRSTRESSSKRQKRIGEAVIGGIISTISKVFVVPGFGMYAESTTSSSDKQHERHQEIISEYEIELKEKMSQLQMHEKEIEHIQQQINDLKNELAILEEQNKYNEVYSSIFAPAEVKRKSHLQVQVYLHLYEESEKVKSLANESDKNAERRDYIPLSLKLRNGDKVDVEFNVYGETRLMSERKSIIWQGSFTKCSFDYFVPKDIDVDELSCEANLSVNGAMIGDMRFITQIVNAPRNLNPGILSHRFNKIFISYAHQDAQQIKLLALAYKAQGVDYFYDRDSLAPGDIYEEKIFDYIDTSDLFVLCWSKNAAASDYVTKEKGRALLRAYPQLNQKDATLKICPISIEPRADLPSEMKEIYNFEII